MESKVKVNLRRPSTKLSSKHQATIPVRVLAQTGVEAGDRLVVSAVGPGRIVLECERELVDEFAGCLDGFYHPNELDKLRDEWR